MKYILRIIFGLIFVIIYIILLLWDGGYYDGEQIKLSRALNIKKWLKGDFILMD